jgi:hypothetical protein
MAETALDKLLENAYGETSFLCVLIHARDTVHVSTVPVYCVPVYCPTCLGGKGLKVYCTCVRSTVRGFWSTVLRV